MAPGLERSDGLGLSLFHILPQKTQLITKGMLGPTTDPSQHQAKLHTAQCWYSEEFGVPFGWALAGSGLPIPQGEQHRGEGC